MKGKVYSVSILWSKQTANGDHFKLRNDFYKANSPSEALGFGAKEVNRDKEIKDHGMKLWHVQLCYKYNSNS